MLTSRDRRRFERAAARAMRPSGRLSLVSTLTSWSTRPVVLGLALVALAAGVAAFYASRASVEPSKPDVAVGGTLPEQPAPARETAAARPADAVRPADTSDVRTSDARQAHLKQLQPVLRGDAERLSQIARRARTEARVNAGDLRALFGARTLSADLPNHYPDYSQAKERLRRSAADQEDELSQTSSIVTAKLSLPPAAEQRRTEVTSALLERCLDKGPGMTLTTRPDGYQYTVRGRTKRYGGGAAVAEDEGAAFAAFTSFAPEADVIAHCDSLKKRAAGIVAAAEKLAADAQALSEQATLSGDCKFTKAE
jgi:hypothetical protein